MRTNPISPQADVLPAGTSARPASSDVSGPSFNQFLNKEIASPKNTSGNSSNQNNVNNNNSNVSNNSGNDTNNQVDNKAADKPAQADAGSKTDKPKESTDKESDGDTDQKAAAAVGDQTSGAQLIALVENLGKLALDKTPSSDTLDGKKVDLSAIAAAGKSAIAGQSMQLASAKADTAADGKALTSKDAGIKIDADLAGTKPVDGQLLQSTAPEDADAAKARDAAALGKATDARDTAKDTLQQIRSPVETGAGAGQKLEAAQELAASKTLIQDSAAAVTPVQQTFTQQLAATAAQGSTAAAEHLAPRVGAPGWDQAVGQKIVWMVAGGKQTAELTLNPPDLGPMQVVLSVNNDKASATFVTAQPEVREALESALPKLRQMMNDSGVQLSGFSVSTQSSNQGGQFAGNNSSGSPRFTHSLPDADTGPLTSMVSATSSRASKLGMVDTFA